MRYNTRSAASELIVLIDCLQFVDLQGEQGEGDELNSISEGHSSGLISISMWLTWEESVIVIMPCYLTLIMPTDCIVYISIKADFFVLAIDRGQAPCRVI